MAKTKMKRSVARRRKSGKKTKTRNRKRKNVIRGGFNWNIILAAVFGAAKQSGMVPECKSHVTGPANVCKKSYGNSDYIPFIKGLGSTERTELINNVFTAHADDKDTDEKDTVWTEVESDVFNNIDWANVNNIDDMDNEYENGIKQKASERAASSNTQYDKVA